MRLLVIEDEHRIAQAIQTGLKQERYIVDVAHDGQEGWDLATTEEYDLIILDIMLPGMNGITICQKLRAKGYHLPILILTAKDDTASKVQGLESGADDYLTKPFAFAELLARVRALLRRPSSPQVETLTYLDLSLNPHLFTVKRADQPISLSIKEFALLEYFLRHPQQVLTKDQLITQVWNYDADILPNTLEVTIRHLRQKIEVPFPKLVPLITTVRGYGYKLGK